MDEGLHVPVTVSCCERMIDLPIPRLRGSSLFNRSRKSKGEWSLPVEKRDFAKSNSVWCP